MPHADLLPEPFKIIQTPGEILILYEVETIFRQIFTDGRKHPTDPSPTWLGYSVGKWDGDTLVVDTMGFNDLSWLDARGHGHSEDMRVEERFHRRDFGHLDVTVTITDPKIFTKPVTINFVEELLPDTDVFEHICRKRKGRGAPTGQGGQVIEHVTKRLRRGGLAGDCDDRQHDVCRRAFFHFHAPSPGWDEAEQCCRWRQAVDVVECGNVVIAG